MAVAFGFGLKPETQLAELAGVPLDYDPVFRQWLPRADTDGRCGNIYLAGDGATIGGAQAAALTGTLAACAALEDRKIAVTGVDRARARRQVARLRRFQRGLARAFAWPVDAIHGLDDDVMVCRCEGISAGDLRAAIRAGLRPDRGEPPESDHALRHGPLPGALLRARRRGADRACARRAARSGRASARAAAGQAAAIGGKIALNRGAGSVDAVPVTRRLRGRPPRAPCARCWR